MALAAGALGFGVHQQTSVLAYSKGSYTHMPLYPWKVSEAEAGKTFKELAAMTV
jgi:hypothetical protein